ncbi:hypothetical protein M3Y98_01189000 [Aphelenchoides besseyi]|nr:hypothetical protein M3Y98_01189000 [Aphelenchoides besseyi]KAI6195280.1 hypothetical protein M3Y96_01214100 [Aphelenchoides besseyi]
MKFRIDCCSFPLLLGFVLSITHTAVVEATCPTRFYAQAITNVRAADVDIYFSRAEVPTATDCAVLCGRRDFCRTAIYNHDAKSCALSYDISVECITKKQRYNTFHLTSEGADSISLLTCVDLCDKEKQKFQAADQTKNTAFSRNEPPKTLQKSSDLNTRAQLVDESEAEGKLRGHGDRGNFITLTRGVAAKTIDNDESPSNAILEALQRLMKTVDAQLQNATSQPANRTAEVGSVIGKVGAQAVVEVENKKAKKNSTATVESEKVTREFGTQIFDLPDLRKSQETESNGTKKTDETKRTIEADELITSTKTKKRVDFHAAPLTIQEVFNGTMNSSAIGRGQVYRSGGSSDNHKGGFFSWLRPGERLQLPADLKLPPELATVAPELFNAIQLASKENRSQESQPTKQTITRFAKISVTDESPVQKKPIATVREVFNSKGESIPVVQNKNGETAGVAESVDPVVINGRLLTVDEIRSLINREQSTSTTTTTVKPWKPASQLFGASEEDEEEIELTTTKKTKPSTTQPHKRPQHDERSDDGFLNTFLISGISSMIHGNGDQEEPEDDNSNAEKIRLSRLGTKNRPEFPTETTTAKTTTQQPSTTTTDFLLTSTTGPIVCYRQIPQQMLLYAAFKTFHDISLNECRCKCAETWLDMTTGPHCKSVLYNEVSRECSLNQGDHNGKYDLIYDKLVASKLLCLTRSLDSWITIMFHLLNAAKRVCSRLSSNTNFHFTSPKQHNETKTSESEESEPMNSSDQQRAKDAKVAGLGISKIDELTDGLKKLAKTAEPKTTTTEKSTTVSSTTVSTTTTSVPPTTMPISTTIIADDELLIQEVTGSTADTRAPLFSSTTLLTTSSNEPNGEDADLLIQEVTSTANATVYPSTDPVDPMARSITTKWKEESGIFVSTSTQISTTTTSYDILTISGHTDGCFEIIHGFMMRSTAGGLEHNVTLAECECYCANSLNSKRYSFQCVSATYYHNERDCVLNLDNRELSPELFMKSSDDDNVSYLGLICPQTKAVAHHTKDGECKTPLKQKPLITPKTTTQLPTPTLAPHTDDCFLELPKYVLEGTALAIESNVTVDECKCYCVDSEHRYGTECQSVEYYYDSQTCLLNKENRLSDPDRFNYDPQGFMHSYFDYRCHSEKLIMEMYVEQVCTKVIDHRIDEIEKSLDVDENNHDNEVHLVTQTQLPYSSKENTGNRRHKTGNEKERGSYVKVLKFVNEDETDSNPMPSLLLNPLATQEKEKTDNESDETKVDGREEDEESEEQRTEHHGLLKRRRNRHRHREPATYQSETEEIIESDSTVSEESRKPSKDRNEQKTPKLAKTTTTATTVQLTSTTTSMPKTTEQPKETTTLSTTITTTTEVPITETTTEKTTTVKPKKAHQRIAEIEELEGEEELRLWEATSTTTPPTTSPVTTTTQRSTTTRPQTTSTVRITTTTEEPSTTTTSMVSYPPVGQCRYSALYQTAFNGERLIRRFKVQNAVQCFQGCSYHKDCRSANLIHTGGKAKFCELFKDSVVDFRRTDVLYFDRDVVHFDSIQCDPA